MITSHFLNKDEDLLDKPVIILDDDLSDTNRFRVQLVYPEVNEMPQPAVVSSLVKLEHHVAGINHTRTGVRGSLLSLRKSHFLAPSRSDYLFIFTQTWLAA